MDSTLAGIIHNVADQSWASFAKAPRSNSRGAGNAEGHQREAGALGAIAGREANGKPAPHLLP